ncbi:MAG: NAD(P)/FAD-dependent oxidoreductase [Capsulimonadales bacterium]|nr:NAD(P)/FAD-dependent oxidoreductase [Capsulimonadales bacterium]
MNENRRPKVIIIGGGFAGLAAAKQMRGMPVEITLIDRTNHHLFQPLLYQVATAALAPSDIAVPIRHILRNQRNIEVVLGEVTEIDPERRTVKVGEGTISEETRLATFEYDYLVVAAGWRHSYRGRDEWEKFAPGLKSLNDALEIRERFLLAFEQAEQTDDPEERAALLTFVIIGAGPTGVELAGVIPEIAKRAMHSEFRRIDTANTRVILLEGGKRILSTFDESLAAKTQQDLEGMGVEVVVNALVTDVTAQGVTLKDGTFVPTRNIIWGAGNAASPLGKMLGAPLNRFGQVQVNPDLSVPGHPEIFVAGDLAETKMADGKPVPAVAQGAMQGGVCAGRNVRHLLYREPTEPFRYFDKGNMAVIGRNRAILDSRWIKMHGFFAWCAWLFIHILYLINFRNRLSVLMQWAYAYFTFQRGVRLISGRNPERYENAGARVVEVSGKPLEQREEARTSPERSDSTRPNEQHLAGASTR